MRRVLVTGGSGFLGTNAIEYFLRQGIPVLNLDLRLPVAGSQHDCWRRVDILDLEALRDAVGQFSPTHVIHLAARTDLDASAKLNGYRANTDGTQNLVKVLEKAKTVQKSFFASSMLVCELGYHPTSDNDYRPNTIYGESKVIGEQFVRRSYTGNWVVGRLTSIWGPWFGRPYRQFFELVVRGLYFSPGKASATKTFGYVENTISQIDALLLAPHHATVGRVFYLGDKPPLNIEKWADAIATEASTRLPWRIPLAALSCAARIGDAVTVLGLDPPMTSFRLRNMTTDNVVDLEPLLELVGPRLVSTTEGVRRTLLWLREQNVRGGGG